MACAGANDGGVKEFVTETAAQMPNSNFDSWIKKGKNLYPDADLADNFWWDSGNEGANILSEKNPTSEEKTVVVSGSACKMSSIAILGNFAAGNVYTGDFGAATISGGAGATLSFGRPFTSRPSKLIGYYKYNPGQVNYGSHGLSSGDTDQCHIYVAMTDWSAPFQVNTSKDIFVDFEDESIIGYGSLIKQESVSGDEVNGYMKFEIPIDYRSTTKKPTYILVVATSSRYGDYFTGSTSSVLYLDELQLVYDDK
jgi:hypothetical protein